MRYFLLFLLLVAPAFPANIYVRQDAGGSNNGTDWTNAYTTFPAMGSITRGDVIYVADTSSTLTIPALSKAASSTTRITIQKATVASHGTSTGWSDTYGDGQAVISKLAIQTGYWTIDGQSRSGIRSGYGFKIDGNTSPSNTTLIAAGDTGPTSCPNTIIRYVEVHGSGDQTDTYNDDGLVTPITGGSSNLTVEYCWFHDFGSVPFALRFADNALVQHCVIERNDSSPDFHSEGFVLAQSSGITVRYNLISDIEGSAYVGTPYAVTNALTDTEIHGNVFEMPETPLRGGATGTITLWDIVTTGYFRCYNNTSVGIRASKVSGHAQYSSANPGFLVGLGYEGSNSVASYDAQNNLWVDCDAVADPEDDTSANITTFTWNNQAYYNTTNTADPSPGTKQVLGSDPLPNWESGDYHLDFDTDAWATLTGDYAVDPDGETRTSSRGAYQYLSGGGDVTAPTPNPATISGTPTKTSTTITVTATTATDETDLGSSPYRFSSDNGSTWTSYQASASYTFTGLTPSTSYNIKVQYQDAAANAGTASSATSVTTDAPAATVRNPAKSRMNSGGF